MDPRLLKYYNQELQHAREVGAEFAQEFPKIAARLGLDSFECSDPYVERLFEGFAFMAARVRLKVDAEFPTFTQSLLDIVYPHYLAATPSMTVVQFQTDFSDAGLADGFVIPHSTALFSQISKGEQTRCEYRTSQAVQLLPIAVSQLSYLPSLAEVSSQHIAAQRLTGIKAGLRIVLKSASGLPFNKLALDKLPLFLRGSGSIPYWLYEQLIANAKLLVGKYQRDGKPIVQYQTPPQIRGMGFGEDEALIKNSPRSFEGYRLLQEYFAFPERFLFVEFGGLSSLCAECTSDELDVLVLFDRSQPHLVNVLDANNLALFCAPAINLFPKRADRLNLDPHQPEQHIVVDRTRPMDYEVQSVTQVIGYGHEQNQQQAFLPFYGTKGSYQHQAHTAFYALRRQQRVLSAKQKRSGVRSSYIGNEVFIALVDAKQAPYASDLSQLGLDVLCTNRDLPLVMPVGVGDSDFSLQISTPVTSIRCIVGPTRPIAANYEQAWRLINHLSLNYLSLTDNDAEHGAWALRELLSLYADVSDVSVKKQVEGVLSVAAKNVVRRIDSQGPLVFGRGLEITVRVEETAFEGYGSFLFGAVLEQFLARYVSINSFVETLLHSTDRGEVAKWPVRIGRRHTI